MARKVVIAIPAYMGEVHVSTMQSLFGDVQTLRDQGVEVQIITREGLTEAPGMNRAGANPSA